MEILISYIFTCLLYLVCFKNMTSIIESVYQNSSSKSRNQIKKIKENIQLRNKTIACLIWPAYEAYILLKKDE